jgi:hypothetical protein
MPKKSQTKKTGNRKDAKKKNTTKAGSRRKVRQSRVGHLKAMTKRKPPFRDESLAPKVDRSLLLALVRRELPEGTARALYRLIYSFKSWSEAYCNTVVSDFHATKQPSV